MSAAPIGSRPTSTSPNENTPPVVNFANVTPAATAVAVNCVKPKSVKLSATLTNQQVRFCIDVISQSIPLYESFHKVSRQWIVQQQATAKEHAWNLSEEQEVEAANELLKEVNSLFEALKKSNQQLAKDSDAALLKQLQHEANLKQVDIHTLAPNVAQLIANVTPQIGYQKLLCKRMDAAMQMWQTGMTCMGVKVQNNLFYTECVARNLSFRNLKAAILEGITMLVKCSGPKPMPSPVLPGEILDLLLRFSDSLNDPALADKRFLHALLTHSLECTVVRDYVKAIGEYQGQMEYHNLFIKVQKEIADRLVKQQQELAERYGLFFGILKESIDFGRLVARTRTLDTILDAHTLRYRTAVSEIETAKARVNAASEKALGTLRAVEEVHRATFADFAEDLDSLNGILSEKEKDTKGALASRVTAYQQGVDFLKVLTETHEAKMRLEIAAKEARAKNALTSVVGLRPLTAAAATAAAPATAAASAEKSNQKTQD